MPIQNTDLLVIQQAGVAYKVSAQTLKTFIDTPLTAASAATLGGIKVGTNLAIAADGTLSASITGALVYKGVLAHGANAPATPVQGHTYVFSDSGNLTGTGWGAIANQPVNNRDMVLYDGTKWDLVGMAGGGGSLTGVTGTAPVTVTNTDPAKPNISVGNAIASATGAGGSAGLLTAVDKEKLDGIASGAKAGTVTTISATAPLHVTTPTTTPALTIDDATVLAKGVVQLADAAAITGGTAGRVVDAAQLKVVSDAVATAAGGGITSVVGTAPVTVTGTTTRTITVSDASTTAKGIVQLATSAETAFDFATPSATHAATPAGVKANYMPLDIAKLTLLP